MIVMICGCWFVMNCVNADDVDHVANEIPDLSARITMCPFAEFPAWKYAASSSNVVPIAVQVRTTAIGPYTADGFGNSSDFPELNTPDPSAPLRLSIARLTAPDIVPDPEM